MQINHPDRIACISIGGIILAALCIPIFQELNIWIGVIIIFALLIILLFVCFLFDQFVVKFDNIRTKK